MKKIVAKEIKTNKRKEKEVGEPNEQ